MNKKTYFLVYLAIIFFVKSLNASEVSDEAMDDNMIQISIINKTRKNLNIRLRYGKYKEKGEVQPPKGAITILHRRHANNPDVFKLNHNQGVESIIDIEEFPLRMRIWEREYLPIPDNDFENYGLPAITCEENNNNTLFAYLISQSVCNDFLVDGVVKIVLIDRSSIKRNKYFKKKFKGKKLSKICLISFDTYERFFGYPNCTFESLGGVPDNYMAVDNELSDNEDKIDFEHQKWRPDIRYCENCGELCKVWLNPNSNANYIGVCENDGIESRHWLE